MHEACEFVGMISMSSASVRRCMNDMSQVCLTKDELWLAWGRRVEHMSGRRELVRHAPFSRPVWHQGGHVLGIDNDHTISVCALSMHNVIRALAIWDP